ncbi:PepSY domain-containing protein [uncultured Anaerococcus sp.]|uniref:PepSY domain-containing protein n=1 Tax=uncultured Anaerococcus sp. TaxID=293428 RepID=UPI0025FD8BA6|nr:PepSY domain-containing protein [uncultured Anaerococcus sp.]
MNKKILALLLATSFVFAGCNGEKANTKEETKVEEKAEAPADDNNKTADDSKDQADDNKKTSTAEMVMPDNKVTLKAASYKFESHVGGAPYNLTEVSYEVEDGEAYYTFEGEKNGDEYKLKVNANSAETTEAEMEKGADKENPIDLGKAIPPEEAMHIALESNGGGEIEEWKLYNDGEGEKYKFELKDGKEIIVNAINKKIM